MTTNSTRLGLVVQTEADQFDTSHFTDNWAILDGSPGLRTIAIGNAPTWGPAHAGMYLSDPATGLLWRWTGSAFVRAHALGHLGQGQRTTDLTEATGSFVVLAQASGVVVPAGSRKVQITASWSEVTGDPVQFGLFRGSTQLTTWKSSGDGGSVTFFDSPSAGTYTYSFQVKTLDASSTVECAADAPARIDVVEV